MVFFENLVLKFCEYLGIFRINKLFYLGKTLFIFYTFALLNRRLYNPEVAFGDFSGIKGELSVAK
jgi:hypothetical protein